MKSPCELLVPNHQTLASCLHVPCIINASILLICLTSFLFPWFQVNAETDRKESMRIAAAKPSDLGFLFACTVCRKRFQDYANMCRHRRLAHQRSPGGLSLGPRSLYTRSQEDVDDDSPVQVMEADPYYNFYVNVSKNIADNLSSCLDGTQERIDNTAKSFIKWKGSKEVTEKTDKDSKKSQVALTKYNFPQGFKLRPPQQIIKVIEKANDEPQSLKTEPSGPTGSGTEDTEDTKQRYRTRNRTRTSTKKTEEKQKSSPAKVTEEVAKEDGKEEGKDSALSVPQVTEEVSNEINYMCSNCYRVCQ